MTDLEDILKKPDDDNTRLLKLFKELKHIKINNKYEYETKMKLLQRKYKIMLKKNVMLNKYKEFLQDGKINEIPIIEKYCITKSVRNMQGIINITVMMSDRPNGKKFTCAYNCSYCPDVPNYPRSYYPNEPCSDRAYDNQYDPVKQIYARIEQYIHNGIMEKNKEDMIKKNNNGYKIDMVIEGGTFTSYPKDYRDDFIHKLFYACNIYYEGHREMYDLETEKQINENSLVRIIGMSIETRPDTVNEKLVKELRMHGVTRVQLGIQHLDDDILRYINRECYTKDTIRALRILFDNSFKVAAHFMPDLPGSTMEKDLEMWDLLFNSSSFGFDYVKLYPCMTLPYTKIYEMFKDGTYVPYASETTIMKIGDNEEEVSKIIPVCLDFLMRCKKWHRVERVLRDLPTMETVAGCKTSNLRQVLENIMEKYEMKCVEIRHREIRDNIIEDDNIKMSIDVYDSCGGVEYFISYESLDEKYILGFIRLRLPDIYDNCSMEELQNTALIREIHIYGQASGVGTTINNNSQHRGYGTKLLNNAEEIAKSKGFDKIAVISGEGVKGFYRKNGYDNGKYYMYKDI